MASEGCNGCGLFVRPEAECLFFGVFTWCAYMGEVGESG